ncbi:transporter substrate-binding domain-containing protein [Mesorhizobium sp. M1A.F.Ca.IN.022.07.1.1]|nr:transporter substrate-binding domain-containing protein [Mesorhizobium sp. M1A.F.Ca.IN.022.07.1.1]RWM64891.1 MAG: transporter substrate-binding domain-containing protein [Mesorhizobium sp.]RWM89070.1 MAG: transporter substrate-binding domain-containing protein [Mesorhizobium sp.]TIS70031.1 MAG: transporter substrate-binding domain-containing protein [Mesorhizobium sp.]TJV54510.1 MAG: transporter substrate-binding domain-containing protein [Mesorhizobium sp.]
MPNLLTGRVDLIVGSLTITPERAKQVAFTKPYSYAETVVLGQKGLKARKIEDNSRSIDRRAKSKCEDIVVTNSAPEGTSFVGSRMTRHLRRQSCRDRSRQLRLGRTLRRRFENGARGYLRSEVPSLSELVRHGFEARSGGTSELVQRLHHGLAR